MAYAFSSLSTLLDGQAGPNGQPAQSSADIFGAGGPSAVSQQQGGAGGAPKTDTSGDLSGGGGGGSVAPAPKQAPATQPDQDMSAYSGNAAKSAAPKAFGDTLTKIQDTSKAQQDEADRLVGAGVKANDYSLDNATIEQGIGGDPAARGKVTTTLGRTDINPVADLKFTTDTDIDAANNLTGVGLLGAEKKNAIDAGVTHMLQNNNGPSYTPGMANFDRSMLGGNQQFQDLMGAIDKGYTGLQDQDKTIGASSKKLVEDAATKSLADSQAGIRKTLTGDQQALLDQEAARAAQANADLHAAPGSAAAAAAIGQSAKAARAEVRSEMEAIRPGSGAIVDGLSDAEIQKLAAAHLTLHADYTPQDMTTQGLADRFNSIGGILGSKDTQNAGLGTAHSAFSLNGTGIHNSLADLAGGKLQARDKGDQGTIDSVMAALNKQAGVDNASRAATAKNPKALLPEIIKSLGVPDASTGYDPTDPNHLVDPTKYLSFQPSNIAGTDEMTTQQAAQLNALAVRMGLPATYKAGAYNRATPNYSFDKASYMAALNAARDHANEVDALNKEAEKAAADKAAKDAGGQVVTPAVAGAVGSVGRSTANPYNEVVGQVNRALNEGARRGGDRINEAADDIGRDTDPGNPNTVPNAIHTLYPQIQDLIEAGRKKFSNPFGR